MDRHHRTGSVRKKTIKAEKFPRVYIDREADFASLKLSPGIEARSYEKNGFIFCEDKKGRIIEIQVLNLTLLSKSGVRSAA